MNFNRVILMGRLTRDPELRVTAAGNNICNISIAVSRKYTTKDGEQREEAAFVDVVAYGRQAETIQRYFAKGKPILIEGRLKLDQWESNTGEKRSKLGVVLESFSFVGGKDDALGPSEPATKRQPPSPSPQSSDDDLDEEVPF